jgi:hypothetical protein
VEAEPEDWRKQLSAALAEAPPPVAPAPTPTPLPASSHTEEDSIASYMERMLARNRQRVGEGPSEFAMMEPEPTPEAEPMSAEPVAPPPLEPLLPRPKVDHEATRATLESFRDVANRSARSALAEYTFKTTKTELAVQTTLMLLSGSGAVLLLTAPLRGGSINVWPALGCSLAATWMGYRVWQSWRSMNRWRADAAPASSAERTITGDSGAGELSARDANDDPASSPIPHSTAKMPFDSTLASPSPVINAVDEFTAPSATAPASSSVSGSLWDNVWSDPTSSAGEVSPRSEASL